MKTKEVLAQLTGIIFVALGAGFGVWGTLAILRWIFGEKETVDWIGIVLGVILGVGLGTAFWMFIMWKTKWLTFDEIMKVIEGRKRN